MAQFTDAWLEGQDKRRLRPDAHRWIRPDAHRWFRPDAERWLRPGDEDWPLLQSKIGSSYRRSARGLQAEPTPADELDQAARLEALRVQSDLAAEQVLVKARRLAELLRRYSPDQPRWPAGNPQGGRWRREDDGDAPVINDPRVLSDAEPDLPKPGDRLAQVRPPRGPFPGATPAQNARLAAAEMRAEAAIRRVREIDPRWEPPRDLTAPNSIEGAIARVEAHQREAEKEFSRLAHTPHGRLLEAYRDSNATPDLFHRPWSRADHTVAVATPEQQQVFFGINSKAPTYTTRDAVTAGRELVSMIEQFPKVMNRRDITGWPNYSLSHAESTILFRMRDSYGGTLAGRDFEITVDRPMCPACEYLLPHLGRRLGNPMVTWYDDIGLQGIMHYSRWLYFRKKKQ